MKAHDLHVVGSCLLSNLPKNDYDAVPKLYVDLMLAGTVFITDVMPIPGIGINSIVGQKEYAPDTIPPNSVVVSALTNTKSLRVFFLAEPDKTFGVQVMAKFNDGSSEAPSISISPHESNTRLYKGYLDLDLDITKDEDIITVISSTGAEASVLVKILIGGPEISSITLGNLPAGQTELKEGDVLPFSGLISNSAESVYLEKYGLSTDRHFIDLGPKDSAGQGLRNFSGYASVSGLSGLTSLKLIGLNLLGTEGPESESMGVILNQSKPIIGEADYTYPENQLAIKDSESVSVHIPIESADILKYDVNPGLTLVNPNIFEDSKYISRSGEIIQYSVGLDLLTVTAIKRSNGALTIKRFPVNVVNTPPSADLFFIDHPIRLRSSGDGEKYVLAVQANQPILKAPDSLEVQSSTGSLSGDFIKKSDLYTIDFIVKDSDLKGIHYWINFKITGLSGLQAGTITEGDSYEIGGFVSRTLTIPELANIVFIGTEISDFYKVRASYLDSDELTRVSSLEKFQKSFSVVTQNGVYSPTGNSVYLNDSDFLGTNTLGTLKIEVEELE
jgi:hypothetical protein